MTSTLSLACEQVKGLSKTTEASVLENKLKKTCSALARVEADQVSSTHDQDLLQATAKLLAARGYLQDHSGSRVRVLTACVLAEMFRLLDDPFSGRLLADTLEFFITQLRGVGDPTPASFALHFHVLEETRRNSLLEKLFETLLREVAQCSSMILQVRNYILEILKEMILEPEFSLPYEVMMTMFHYLLPPAVDTKTNAFEMVCDILISCESKLSNLVMDTVYELMSTKNNRGELSSSSSHAHLICKLAELIPTSLITLVPKLQELLEDEDPKKRLQYVTMFGKILTLGKSKLPVAFMLKAFLKRFTDIDGDVRMKALEFSHAIIQAHSDHQPEIVENVQSRCTDIEDRVRTAAISTLYSLAVDNLAFIPSEALLDISKRIMDKSELVRLTALRKCAELLKTYRDSEERDDILFFAEQLVRATHMNIARVPILAEKLFDEKFLGLQCTTQSRCESIVQTYPNWPSAVKQLFKMQFVSSKISLQKEFLSLLELNDEKNTFTDAEKTSFDVKLARFLAKFPTTGISTTKQNEFLSSIMNHKDRNTRRWLEMICRSSQCDEEGAKDLRSALSQLRRTGTTYKWPEQLSDALLVRLSSTVFNCSSIEHLVKSAAEESMKEDVQEQVMDLVVHVALNCPGIAGRSIPTLVHFLSDDNPNMIAHTLKILGTCAVNADAWTELEAPINAIIGSGPPEHVKLACAVAKSISPESSSFLENTLNSAMENMDIGNSGLIRALAIISKLVTLNPVLVEAVRAEFVPFIFNELLDYDSDEEWSGITDDSTVARALGIEVLTNYIVANPGNPDLVMETLRVVFSHITVATDSPEPSSKGIFIVCKAIQCLSHILSISEFEQKLSIHDFCSIAWLALSPSSEVRNTIYTALWCLIKEGKLSFKYSCGLVLSAMDPDPQLMNKCTKYLEVLVSRENNRNQALLKMTRDRGENRALRIDLYPEYTLAYLAFTVGNHHSFDGSFEACYYFLPCLELMLKSLIPKEGLHNFALIASIIAKFRETEVVSDSASATKFVYMNGEMLQLLLNQHVKGQSYDGTQCPRGFELPSSCFRKRLDNKIDTVSYLPSGFNITDVNTNLRKLRTKGAVSKKRKATAAKKNNQNVAKVLSESDAEESEDSSDSDSSIGELITRRQSLGSQSTRKRGYTRISKSPPLKTSRVGVVEKDTDSADTLMEVSSSEQENSSKNSEPSTSSKATVNQRAPPRRSRRVR